MDSNKLKNFDQWNAFNKFLVDAVKVFKEYGVDNNVDIWFLAHQTYDADKNYDEDVLGSVVFPALRGKVQNDIMGAMDYIFHTYIDAETDIDEDNKTVINESYKVHIGVHHVFKTKLRGKAPNRKSIDQDKVSLEKLMKKINGGN
jgi:hypothetical protein